MDTLLIYEYMTIMIPLYKNFKLGTIRIDRYWEQFSNLWPQFFSPINIYNILSIILT